MTNLGVGLLFLVTQQLSHEVGRWYIVTTQRSYKGLLDVCPVTTSLRVFGSLPCLISPLTLIYLSLPFPPSVAHCVCQGVFSWGHPTRDTEQSISCGKQGYLPGWTSSLFLEQCFCFSLSLHWISVCRHTSPEALNGGTSPDHRSLTKLHPHTAWTLRHTHQWYACSWCRYISCDLYSTETDIPSLSGKRHYLNSIVTSQRPY